MLKMFTEAFNSGLSLEQAIEESGIPASEELVRYWNLLVMEKAIDEASAYFDKLLEIAA